MLLSQNLRPKSRNFALVKPIVKTMKLSADHKWTLLCILLIWYLCFFTPPKTKLDEVTNFDKLVHCCMYLGTMSIYWIEHWRRCIRRRLTNRPLREITVALLAPIMMSGIIELLQAYCTVGRRSGDWADLAANTVGVVLAYILGITVYKRLSRRYFTPKDAQ